MRPEIRYPFAVYSSRLPARTKSVVGVSLNNLPRQETRKTKNISGPGLGAVALYCAISPHTGMRIGLDEDGRRTWRPVHRSSHQSPAGCCLLLRGSAMWIETSSPTARWLLFVVKGFSNSGSRRMRPTPSRHARACYDK